jgi:ATP-dependent helicase/DNAse subunit B
VEEVSDELPPAERGLILHSVMERFYQALPPEFGGKVTEANLKSSREYLSPVLEDVFSAQEEKGLPIPDLLWEREKRLMEQYIWNAIRFFATAPPWNRTGMQPDAFEFSFGMENESHDALSIQLDDKTLKLRGRADRLDLNRAGEFTVVDYKTSGGKKVKDFYSGRALQLPLYALAAKEKLKAYEQPLHLSYYSFKKGKEDGKVSLDEEKYESLHTRTLELVDQALFQITSGIFHPTAGECNAYCPFKHMCRCEENRIRMKSE